MPSRHEIEQRVLALWTTTRVPLTRANLLVYTKASRAQLDECLDEMVKDGLLEVDYARPPGRTEHLSADFAWMAGVTGRGNAACCAVLDCVESTVALLEKNETESTVMIGKTVLTLPSAWVHPAQGLTGMWCFIPSPTTGGQPGAYVDSQGRTRAIPPQTPTRENTRCAFFLSIN